MSEHDFPPSFTVTFAKPFKFDGREYAQVVLQEPTVKQVLRADEQLRNGVTPSNLRNREIHLVAQVAGVPVPVVEQMGITEVNRSMGYLNRFLNYGQETGGT